MKGTTDPIQTEGGLARHPDHVQTSQSGRDFVTTVKSRSVPKLTRHDERTVKPHNALTFKQRVLWSSEEPSPKVGEGWRGQGPLYLLRYEG